MSKAESIIDKDKPVFTIGTVAELLNISVQTLRIYEKEGLIIPFKKDSKHRLYSQNDIERLQCIRTAITEMKYSIPAIKSMYSLIPCWKLKPCTNKDMKNCEAYKGSNEPCWTVKHESNVCAEQECRECTVYKQFIKCEQIKEVIKKI